MFDNVEVPTSRDTQPCTLVSSAPNNYLFSYMGSVLWDIESKMRQLVWLLLLVSRLSMFMHSAYFHVAGGRYHS